MRIVDFSIKNPVFIICITVVLIALGLIGMSRLPIDLFPNVSIPVITVVTTYPGAGPQEMDTMITQIIENELSSVVGIKSIRSLARDGVSFIRIEFVSDTDIKYAEQEVKERISKIRNKLPDGIDGPLVEKMDPSDTPTLILTLSADFSDAQLNEFAERELKTKIEQVQGVGTVNFIGGRKREISVLLDRNQLKKYGLSVTSVSDKLSQSGQNIPIGRVSDKKTDRVFRSITDYSSFDKIKSTIISFFDNEVPVTIEQIGTVTESFNDNKTNVFVNGRSSLALLVFRQAGSNMIAVSDNLKKKIATLNSEFQLKRGHPKIDIILDSSTVVRENIDDVKESIILGILLTVIVVYFFLGNGRSTLITGLALPNSLIGAFFFMMMAHFTINMMSLLALGLAVGLLIDDAIVVRENIFRHLEKGHSSVQAALNGTKEVALAVIATTMTVLAVFGSVGFLQGAVGQFFKEFGLTVCFVMIIGLADALTMAPMLSAHYVGKNKKSSTKTNFFSKCLSFFPDQFSHLQNRIEISYVRTLGQVLQYKFLTVTVTVVLFMASLYTAIFHIPKTMFPIMDSGQLKMLLQMPPGTNLETMTAVARKVDNMIRSNKEILYSVCIVGESLKSDTAGFYIVLVPPDKRKGVSTSDVKNKLRSQLIPFQYASPLLMESGLDLPIGGGGERSFTLNIVGDDLDKVRDVAKQVYEKLQAHPGLSDVDTSNKPGKSEVQIILDGDKAQRMGVSGKEMGMELRAQVDGLTPAKYRENGREYDIRVRLKKDQRHLDQDYNDIMIPNINARLVPLNSVATPITTIAPMNIARQDRNKFIQIGADLVPNGLGLATIINDVNDFMTKDIQMPNGVSYQFLGQAESFDELNTNMLLATILGILFVYLVLSCLYSSFILPLTIMLVLPLAAIGAFFALYLTKSTLDVFSMIGCVMLIGISTKNSILLVDCINNLIQSGHEMYEAIILAGKTRLRPILMTTGALIAGMLPMAIGLTEASKQRSGMGIALVGGLISSTFLTLIVIPACYPAIEHVRKRMAVFLV